MLIHTRTTLRVTGYCDPAGGGVIPDDSKCRSAKMNAKAMPEREFRALPPLNVFRPEG